MKKVLIIQLTILTIILVVLIIIYCRVQIVGKQIQEKYSNDSEMWMERMYIENNIYESIRNNNYPLILSDVVREKPLLVCYYSSLSCGTCVNFAMTKLDEYFPNSEKNPQILFIACDFNEKTHFEKRNTIKLNSRKTELPINESTSVCYFILHNGTIEQLFIPEKKYENYTNIYLTEIKKIINE